MEQSEFMREFLKSRKMLFGFIVSIVRDKEAAEDIFQDVSMIAFSKCATFQAGTDFGAWLREIGRRRILKARETHLRGAIILEPETIDAVAAAYDRRSEEKIVDREAALRECIRSLPERGRRLIEMRYQDAQSFESIARRVQSSVNSIQVTMTKIRKALRRCVEAKLAT